MRQGILTQRTGRAVESEAVFLKGSEGEFMSRIAISIAAVCMVLMSLGQNAVAQKESYTAVMVTRTPSTQHVRMTFTITKWATEGEIKRLGKVRKEH